MAIVFAAPRGQSDGTLCCQDFLGVQGSGFRVRGAGFQREGLREVL